LPILLAGQGSALAIIAAYVLADVLADELARSQGRIDEALAADERCCGFIATKQAARFAGAFAPHSQFGL
jgi:2-polyprenyl-6-methoxyphenol hydroxylase-like FAD-dependent oxidoreductase